MRSTILLVWLFIAGMVNAQVVCDYPEGVNTKLIISEFRMTSNADAYLEITNLGTEPVLLSDYKFGTLNTWSRSGPVYDLCNDPWYTDTHDHIYLPNRTLEPGKSFVITTAYDYSMIHYKEGLARLGGSERPKQPEMYEVADKLIHVVESIDGVIYERDSVTTSLNDTETLINRGDYSFIFSHLPGKTFYLEHHYTEGDSAVIDQVGGLFESSGRNFPYVDVDIAGVTGGMNNSIITRKATVAKGNIDFMSSRGVGLDDSEWIPIQLPSGYNAWRDIFWTIGNHGNFVLDENTLESENPDITVDYASKKITVPWGTLRLDEIMRSMKKKPGVAWQYDLNPIKEDSLYRSARSGDLLTIFVVGNALQSATFEIEVKAPTADDNIVLPIDHPIVRLPGSYGVITSRAQNGILSWPRVTRNESGVDTITGSGFGLAFDLRTDTLLRYLEKPAAATWEFVWVDGVTRADLKNGDKLQVTSENGKVKEYFIQVQAHNPNANADLAAITWPDIPEFYRGILGWKGDTIPNFSSSGTNYRVEVPLGTEGVPALVAKTSNLNASVKVIRAKSLNGTTADRTATFEVTAENDTVNKTYNVEFVKEKTPDKIEPFIAEPFFSEFVNSYPSANIFLEIFNPGNQPLDLRDYMVAMSANANPYYPITYNPSWERRYTTYIPGLKHVDAATWAISRKKMIPDPNVNAIIPGGGTFVMATIYRGNSWYGGVEEAWPKWDVQFAPETVPGVPNPWNENVTFSSSAGVPMPINGNRGNFFVLYKVLNDSIKLGLKAIGDIDDFQIIDLWGMADRKPWVVGGIPQGSNQTQDLYIRKPHINKGNPEWGGSFGTNEEDCEWVRIVPTTEYSHLSGTARYAAAYGNIGQHYFLQPSFYKSTVNSSYYNVSDGFGPDEEILGLKAGVTVSEFLSNINKEDENQTLTFTSAADGSVLGMEAVLSMNDKLVVVSADEKNTTVYTLGVTEAGMSSNAYLTSNRWQINVSVDPKSGSEASTENDGVGSISDFNYGTTIKTIVDNINVPAGATLTVIDGDGAYVPFQVQNFDTTYVSVTVNPNIFFEVVAEDNVTRIVYQLQPNTSENDAFILSDVYEVSQMDNLIHFVPRGTNFEAFLANIIPSLGANLKLVDKMGFERVYGNIREDDKVVVTSANGQTTRVYYISFLATYTMPQTTYLAYVLSEAYLVNQVDYVISAGLAPLTSETLMDEFVSYLTPSMGATVSVVDKNGQVKSSGDLNDGDKLVVTSADGKIAVTYRLALDLSSAGTIGKQRQITIFPNPASDKLQIQGVEAGNRIQIFSAAGALVREVKAQSSLEAISLELVPSGMFMIVVSDGQQVLGRYKAIKN